MTVNSACRICGSKELHKVIDLGLQPLANGFLRADQLSELEERFPLEVYVCGECNLVQLIHVVDKETLFSDYIYFSSGMPRSAEHFQQYANDIQQRFLSTPEDFVVEIGSNDGVLLKFFKQKNWPVLGIDPAQNIAALAIERGIPTKAEFFSAALAEQIKTEQGPAQAILANNVVAHINDYDDLGRGIKTLLAPRGVFVFEAPYLIDMFENLTFDTIYHEHLSYLAVRPLRRLFKNLGLEIFDVQIVPAQGQSLRVFVGHEGVYPIGPSVARLVNKEMELGLNRIETYQCLANKIIECKEKVVRLIGTLREAGKRLAGYGAPAKGNTVLNYYGLGAPVLEFILDELPEKQGRYTPGTHLQVVDRAYATAHAPDYYFLLAWNYAPIILDKEKNFRRSGGSFILPTGVVFGATITS